MPRTLIFDTLAHSKRLISAGFTQQQAEIQAETFAEIIDEKIASKRDLRDAELTLTRDMKEMEMALKADIDEKHNSLKRDMKEMEVALRTDINEKHTSLKRDLKELEMKLTIKLGVMMAACIAIVAALVKLL